MADEIHTGWRENLRADLRVVRATTKALPHASVHIADEIVVLSDGRIIESGIHAELVARRGEYAELVRIQSDALAALTAEGH